MLQHDPVSAEEGFLLENLAQFCRLLRGLGMDVGTARIVELVSALGLIDWANKQDFYHVARALLVSCKADYALFDAAFEMFWQLLGRGPFQQSVTISGELPRQARPVVLPPSAAGRENQSSAPRTGEHESPLAIEVTATYSARAVLRHKDFAKMTPEELEEVKRLIGRLVWTLGERRTRRFHPGRGDLIDVRRSIRRSMRSGGEMMEWVYRTPVFKLRPLVLIADISGSMDSYTRLLMRFCFSLARGLRQPVEAFVFASELTRITRQLRTHDVDFALTSVGQTAHDWSGGTRIGEALKMFNRVWGQRVLGRGAVVILISDGLDRGEASLLVEEMARLRRTSHRLIWLNPLLGSARYEPTAYGMQAALPYVHDFLPVHNLASLESLAKHLARLGSRFTGRESIYARHSF